jgi:hypothetical protein
VPAAELGGRGMQLRMLPALSRQLLLLLLQ